MFVFLAAVNRGASGHRDEGLPPKVNISSTSGRISSGSAIARGGLKIPSRTWQLVRSAYPKAMILIWNAPDGGNTLWDCDTKTFAKYNSKRHCTITVYERCCFISCFYCNIS